MCKLQEASALHHRLDVQKTMKYFHLLSSIESFIYLYAELMIELDGLDVVFVSACFCSLTPALLLFMMMKARSHQVEW